MSDCFDHECDAFDSWDNEDRGWDYGETGFGYGRNRSKDFDPLRHFTVIPFVRLIRTNEKSYFILFTVSAALHFGFIEGYNDDLRDKIEKRKGEMEINLPVWIPKSIVRGRVEGSTVTIHSLILRECIFSAFKYYYPKICDEKTT